MSEDFFSDPLTQNNLWIDVSRISSESEHFKGLDYQSLPLHSKIILASAVFAAAGIINEKYIVPLQVQIMDSGYETEKLQQLREIQNHIKDPLQHIKHFDIKSTENYIADEKSILEFYQLKESILFAVSLSDLNAKIASTHHFYNDLENQRLISNKTYLHQLDELKTGKLIKMNY